MVKQLTGLVTLFFIVIFSQMAIAQPSDYSIFDVQQANQEFYELDRKLTRNRLSLENMHLVIKQMQQLQDEAENCIDVTKKKLTDIDGLLSEIKVDESTLESSIDFDYLRKQQKIFEQLNAECRVFVFRVSETLMTRREAIQGISRSKLLMREVPVWHLLTHPENFSDSQFELSNIAERSKLKTLSVWNVLSFIILLVAVTFLGLLLRRRCQQHLQKEDTKNLFWYAFVNAVKNYCIPLFILTACNLFFTFVIPGSYSMIELSSYVILAYALFLFGFAFIFYPGIEVANPISIDDKLAKRFFFKTVVLLSFWLLSALVLIVFNVANLKEETMLFLQSLFIIVTALLLTWQIWGLTKTWRHRRVAYAVNFLLVTSLVGIIVIESLGYHSLSLFILRAAFFTLLLFIVTWLSIRFLEDVKSTVLSSKRPIYKKIREQIGIKPHKTFIEFNLIILAFLLLIGYLDLLGILYIWNFSANLIERINHGVNEGFQLSGAMIYPMRIIIALLVFSLLMLIGRAIATHYSRSQRQSHEAETQVTFASLIIYISFGISVLLALFIAGVNLTGLVVIAGALSVGIGLGLQDIVNNFVAGILLLLEKQLKPGDRVIIGNTEGIIKKIRARSTQLMTAKKEDVIIPNSELINNQVTNYMYKDSMWRVNCQVGVAYGSDIDLVESTLLEIGRSHPDVLNEPPHDPTVLFMSFGDSALLFELWCVIRDVNKKYIVQSQLNFAIDKAFREHQIEIAFPQCDIHIKETPTPKNA